MAVGRALLVSGLVFLAGCVLLGGALLAAKVSAASLGFAMALIIPAGALALLAGGLGLVFAAVAYIQGRDRQGEREPMEKEGGS